MTKFRLGNTRASKLTPLQVIAMRKEWAARTHTQAELARKYLVSIGTVRNVIYGLTWQNLPASVPDEPVMFEAEQSLNRLESAVPVEIDQATIDRLNKQLVEDLPPTDEQVSLDEMFQRRLRGKD
jgi:hypothetical protein